ncbi:sucrose 6(F)-phosphate phosphorylase [Acrasis kona]|uniref:Sucrose 6(F)-phosphate phosphorylase n=1 Tax=Acrasis kona TaxID=1008807 RepID=A0AAW2ZJ09_9EUKA
MSTAVACPPSGCLNNKPQTFSEVIFNFGTEVSLTKSSESPTKRDTIVQHGHLPTLASRNVVWSQSFTKTVKDTHYTDYDYALQNKKIFPVRRETEGGETDFLIHYTVDEPGNTGKVLSTTESFSSKEQMQDSLFLNKHIQKNALFLLATITTTKNIQTTRSPQGKEIVLTTSKSIINNSIPYEHCSLRCESEFDPPFFERGVGNNSL